MYTALAALCCVNGPTRLCAAVRWQPYLDLAADTQTHEPLEDNADRYPFLLLNPPAPAPPADEHPGIGIPLGVLRGVW